MFYGNPLHMCLFILAIFQIACLASGVNLRPVHERNNEQKIDSYGNPLGGNTQGGSRQRVKIYMHDQQKRFNAEKDRMQRAQVQRFQKHGGETMDSYVKAYKDQQESYQKEIETKHAKEVTNITSDVNSVKNEQPSEGRKREVDNKERKDFAPLNRWWKNSRPARNNRGSFKNADSVAARPALRGQHNGKTHSSRSVPFVVSPNYFTPSATHENNGGNYYGFAPQNLFLNPSMTSSILAEGYAPGKYYNTEDVSALTTATLSNSQTHQFSQLSGYKSNEDVESLTALLGRQPGDQLRGLNQLLNQHSNHKLIGDDLSYLNINLKASSLDPSDDKNVNKYDYISPYSTDAQKQLLAYTFDDSQSQVVQTKDHTPITENVQDIADTRGPVQFGLPRPVYPTESPLIQTSLSDNYYKVPSQPSYDVEPKILNSPSPYSASSSSYGSGNDDVSIESETALIFNNLKWNQPRYKSGRRLASKILPRSLINEQLSAIKNDSEVIDRSNNPKKNKNTDFDKENISTHSLVKRETHTSSPLTEVNFMLPNSTTSSIRLKRFSTSKYNHNDIFLKSNLSANNSNSFLDSNIFFTSKDLEQSNNVLKPDRSINETENSEYYYYDDTEIVNDTNSVDFDEEFFPLEESLKHNISNSAGFNESLSNLNLTLIGMNISSDSPHFESLIRYKMRRKPNLYRVVNGIKSKIYHPNPDRFKKLLLKRPRNGFKYIKNPHDIIYGRGTPNYEAHQYNSGYQIERPFRESSGFNIEDEMTGSNEYSEEYDDDEYPDPRDSENEYYEMADYDPQNSETINMNNFKNKRNQYQITKPNNNFNFAPNSHNQYASGYIGNDDYVSGSDNLNYYHSRNYNKRNKYGLSFLKNNIRYASDYNQDGDYVEIDDESDSLPEDRTKYLNSYPTSDNSDYTDSRKAYLEYFKKLSKNQDANKASSQYYSAYSPIEHEEFTDHDNYQIDDDTEEHGEDAGNYYVENFNQFITENKEKKHKKRRPQSNFNIYRTATKLGHKLHNINPGGHIPHHQKHSDVIHIDAVNYFNQKEHNIKPHHHHYQHHHQHQLHHFRPKKHHHRPRRTYKWVRPRSGNRRLYKKTKRVLHVQSNIDKINAKLSNAQIIG